MQGASCGTRSLDPGSLPELKAQPLSHPGVPKETLLRSSHWSGLGMWPQGSVGEDLQLRASVGGNGQGRKRLAVAAADNPPRAALGCWMTSCQEFRSIDLQRDGHGRPDGGQANRLLSTEHPLPTRLLVTVAAAAASKINSPLTLLFASLTPDSNLRRILGTGQV